MPENLFVYGTLMFPPIFEAITGKGFEKEEAVLADHKRFGVVSSKGREQYPGMIEQAGSSVSGVLYRDLDEEALKIIDRLEGSDYIRKSVQVKVNDVLVQAYAYVWSNNPEKKLDGEWKPEDFERDHLNFYLSEKIPRYLQYLREGEKSD